LIDPVEPDSGSGKVTFRRTHVSDIYSAIVFACGVHKGQVDKSGQPYILHPLRLMLKFSGEEERIVSVLHDVVEDGDVSLSDLRQAGFSERVVEAVGCLSRRDDESYEAFIVRVSANELARKVKIEDVKDNLDVTRLSVVTERDLERVAKYHRALMYLLDRHA
jgi:(p)ppGpp synthase/HD superfamily hydrolase